MSEPLNRVAELFSRREQEALSRLGDARVRERRATDDLERIQSLGAEYRAQLQARGHRGLDAAALKHWRGFLAQIDGGTDVQRDNVERVRQHSARAENGWLHARMRADAIHTVQARRVRAAAAIQSRQDQRAQDELALRATRRLQHPDAD